MGVSWNGATPQWMLFVRENPTKIRMMRTGGTPKKMVSSAILDQSFCESSLTWMLKRNSGNSVNFTQIVVQFFYEFPGGSQNFHLASRQSHIENPPGNRHETSTRQNHRWPLVSHEDEAALLQLQKLQQMFAQLALKRMGMDEGEHMTLSPCNMTCSGGIIGRHSTHIWSIPLKKQYTES